MCQSSRRREAGWGRAMERGKELLTAPYHCHPFNFTVFTQVAIFVFIWGSVPRGSEKYNYNDKSWFLFWFFFSNSCQKSETHKKLLWHPEILTVNEFHVHGSCSLVSPATQYVFGGFFFPSDGKKDKSHRREDDISLSLVYNLKADTAVFSKQWHHLQNKYLWISTLIYSVLHEMKP